MLLVLYIAALGTFLVKGVWALVFCVACRLAAFVDVDSRRRHIAHHHPLLLFSLLTFLVYSRQFLGVSAVRSTSLEIL